MGAGTGGTRGKAKKIRKKKKMFKLVKKKLVFVLGGVLRIM
jgi:hypothetical protein